MSTPNSEDGRLVQHFATGQDTQELRRQLADARARVSELEQEIDRRESLGQALLPSMTALETTAVPSTAAQKVALFLELFGTRREVYPQRWENTKTGKSGYAPACHNEWRPGVCRKPQVKCSECPHQKFPELGADAIERHLRGSATLGVYAITSDNRCRFLAADFDGESWQTNVAAYRDAGARAGIDIAVERSRSGKGAHAWIFFRELVPAALARKLGSVLLAKASASQPTMSLAAYDRMFPNQDAVMPGGWGNLIALPLARIPRMAGNTAFLDEALNPITDQWGYLARVQRLTFEQLDAVLGKISPISNLTTTTSTDGPDLVLEAEDEILQLSSQRLVRGVLTGDVTVRLDAKVHIPRTIPVPVLAALRRLVSFPNPVFHEKLRLRFATFDVPRFLFAGEWHPDRLVLPRGTLDAAVQILEEAGASVVVQDHRESGSRCTWRFTGELRTEQRVAVREMAQHDIGVLCAPPGSGKTVMGCALIAHHRTTVLVLVHRSVLLDQWRDAVMQFLGLKRKEIGVWRGSKPRLTRRLDIAMLPSLTRVEDYATVFKGYGLVLIDECHHVPAASFELLLKSCFARRMYGLTATPNRKDRLEKLLHLQCGPIRHTVVSDLDASDGRVVMVRRSSFSIPQENQVRPSIHEVWDALVRDRTRLMQIVADIEACVAEGRSPLVLADRKVYLDAIAALLPAVVAQFRLQSGIGKKMRDEIRSKIDEHFVSKRPFVLLATASMIGEGFDLPRLDTLILSMPLSFRGRLVQYVGRLHRSHEGKASPRVYDYLDENSPLTRAMFRRRLVGYRQMGYSVELPGEEATDAMAAIGLQ